MTLAFLLTSLGDSWTDEVGELPHGPTQLLLQCQDILPFLPCGQWHWVELQGLRKYSDSSGALQ